MSDSELQAVGSETKIPYEGDYDFYLERLHKRSTWTIKTMNFFNVEVFGANKTCEKSSELVVPSAPPCTWEDDFLDNLDNSTSNGPQARNITSASAYSNDDFGDINNSVPRLSLPGSPHHSLPHSPHSVPLRPVSGRGSLSHSDLPRLPHSPPNQISHPPNDYSDSSKSPLTAPTSNAMVSIHNYPGATIAAVSWLQVEVGQMSISGTQGAQMGAPTQTSSACRVLSSRHPAPIPALLPESSMPPVNSGPPLVPKCDTRAHTKAQK
ncbi:hypothetical protein HD554DRAFT_2172509 [Boletus coccyginus]|nr:hypothetical protein HD554DRAFT_2172509 [Boletus coccyginus]